MVISISSCEEEQFRHMSSAFNSYVLLTSTVLKLLLVEASAVSKCGIIHLHFAGFQRQVFRSFQFVALIFPFTVFLIISYDIKERCCSQLFFRFEFIHN